MAAILEKRLAAVLSRTWWMLLLRGLLAIAFALIAWLRPGISLATLVILFGVYVIADGVFGVFSAIVGRKEHEHWFVLLLWGLVGIGVGLLALRNPGATALVLVLYIGLWAIATGLLEIVAAVRLRQEIEGEWRLIAGGVVSVLFGGFMMARPGAGAIGLLWVIAAYAFAFGLLLVILAFKARSVGRSLAAATG